MYHKVFLHITSPADIAVHLSFYACCCPNDGEHWVVLKCWVSKCIYQPVIHWACCNLLVFVKVW